MAELNKSNIHSMKKMAEWLDLGTEETCDSDDPGNPLLTAKGRDPKCRFL
jgi:hypothetical protein